MITSELRFVSMGFGNICQANEIWAVMRIGSAQSKRILADAKADDRFFDWTGKRHMRSILLLKNGMVCSSPFSATTVYNRLKAVTSEAPIIIEEKILNHPGRPLEYDANLEEGGPDIDELDDDAYVVDNDDADIEDSDDADFEEEKEDYEDDEEDEEAVEEDEEEGDDDEDDL